MPQYEYRVIPAPGRGFRTKGYATAEARFANALQTLMNDMGMRGWEYQRAETLPASERDGDSAGTTEWRNMLVFRRQIPERSPLILRAAERLDVRYPAKPAEEREEDLPAIVRKHAPAPAETPVAPQPARSWSKPASPDEDASESEGARRMLRDNGVEDHSDVSGMSNALLRLATARNPVKSKT